MDKQIIFETERLLVRKLLMSDLKSFHAMQSNPKVMQYVTGEVKSIDKHKKELSELIEKYDKKNNSFWIYAAEEKLTKSFVGTCALIKDGDDDELGYRFLEEYWGLGYGLELCKGLIGYCKELGFPKLIGYVVDINIASSKILAKCDFKIVEKGLDPNLKIPDTKYELIL